MKIRTFFFIFVCALLVCSCKSTKRTMQRDSASIVEENSQTEVTVRTESVKPVDQPDRTMYRYYVIIGSFRVLDNARKQTAEIAKKGFTPEILESETGYYRISVGGFNEESAARSRIAGIRSMHKDHADVWLLIRQ